MAAAVDGSIRIDSRIDEKGFNTGVRNMSARIRNLRTSIRDAFESIPVAAKTAFKFVGETVRNLGARISGIFKKVLLGGLLALGLSLVGIVRRIGETFSNLFAVNLKDTQLSKDIEAIRNKFTELKFSIAAAFLPLIQIAVPYIKLALDWLIQLFNKVAMIIAAFLGQKEVLQVIAGSAQEIADANKKTEKAAKGQLAAFDQINVLQKSDTGTDLADLPQVATQLVPIDNKWITFAENIKQAWLDMIQRIKDAWARFVDAWNAFWSSPFGQLIQALWRNFVDTWQRIYENTRDTLIKIWEGVQRVFTGIGEFLVGVFTGNWRLAWEGIKDIVGGVFDIITAWVKGSIRNWIILFEGLKTHFALIGAFLLGVWQNVWTFIQLLAVGTVKTIQSAWADLANWFNIHVIEPIRRNFETAINWIRTNFSNAFSGIADAARGAFNNLIDAINGVLQRVANTINSMAWMFNQFSWIFGFQMPTVSAPQIPRLATGAVIPPNSQFLAVLGDQKSGKNIEAPENLIRQIIREEMGSGETTATAPIILTLDGEVVYRNQQRIQMRRGKSLIGGA